jgi:hypothetical protein
MAAGPVHYINRNEQLGRCERCSTYISWPVPINHRLDELVDLARHAGYDLNRNELLAALVFAMPPDGQKLGRLVVSYQRAKAGDAVLAPGPIPVLQRKPGRRPKRPRRA